jgi:membrane protein
MLVQDMPPPKTAFSVVDGRRWRLISPGAVIALLVWLLASSAFALYASRFGSYDKSWGTISAVVVTLVWLWLTSAALLFGAEIDAVAQRRSH